MKWGRKLLGVGLLVALLLSLMSVVTFTASAETTVIYKFTFEQGGDTILKKADEFVGEIVEFGAAGNHALKYELNSTTHTGAGVHPFIWPNGVGSVLAAQGDLAGGETYELTIDIACDGNTAGSYMYPFMLCNGESENYFDHSSFSPSGTFQTYTFVLSSLSEGVPLPGQDNGGICFVDEGTLFDDNNMYIDNVTLTKVGAWKAPSEPASITYCDGTPAEESVGAGGGTPSPVTTTTKATTTAIPTKQSTTTTNTQFAGEVEITASNVLAKPGEEVDVDFYINKNSGFWGMSLDITYDTSLLTMKSIRYGDSFVNELDFLEFESEVEHFAINAIGKEQSNCKAVGLLATATFVVNEKAVAGDRLIIGLKIDQWNLLNVGIQEIESVLHDGSVVVKEDSTISVIPGDANDDGELNMKDVLIVRKYIANMGICKNLVAADINGDKEVNMKDVLVMRKKIAGML